MIAAAHLLASNFLANLNAVLRLSRRRAAVAPLSWIIAARSYSALTARSLSWLEMVIIAL